MDEEKRESATFRMVSKDEEDKKRVEKDEVLNALNPDTLRYIEKKDKGVIRMERHPADGLSLAHGPPKSGHGGKFTWEGPTDVVYNELLAPPAIDEGDPNYVDDDDKERMDNNGVDVIIGDVEVAKCAEAKEGVSRIEIKLPLQP